MRARHVLHAAVVALGASAIASGVALAQSYPARPITFVVPFPPGTAPAIVAKLNGAINEIVGSAEMKPVLEKLSGRSKLGRPQEFAAFITEETRRWSEIVKAANIRID